MTSLVANNFTIRRWLLNVLLLLVSLVPFNYLQFITFTAGPWQVPFYYLLLGIPIFILSIWSFIGKGGFYKNDIVLMLSTILVALFLSLIDAVNTTWAVRNIASFVLRGPLVVIAMLGLYGEKKNIQGVIDLASITVVLVAWLGIFEAILGKNPIWDRIYLAHNPYYLPALNINLRGGICSSVGHPLPFASFLTLMLPITLLSNFFYRINAL